jgi:hypothetical protein
LLTLLPVTAPSPVLLVNPVKVAPSGLKGFVGIQQQPFGEIYGATVNALAIIQISADDVNALNSAVESITSTLMALDREELAQQRIYRMVLSNMGQIDSDAVLNIVRRELVFEVLYEFLQLPTEGGETITDVAIESDLSLGTAADFLLDSGFDSDSLALFDVIDDSGVTVNGPSNWQFNATESRIEQTTAVRGGSQTLSTPRKSGSYLVLQTSSSIPVSRNVIFTNNLSSTSRNGIGVVFRFQDEDNFYFFLMSDRHNYRIFGKKIAGNFSFLDSGGVDDSVGYQPATAYRLKIIANGESLQALLDDQLALSGQDASIDTAGRVGFMTHGNNGAQFHRIRLVSFDEN